jgi:hypothetical protein
MENNENKETYYLNLYSKATGKIEITRYPYGGIPVVQATEHLSP